MSKLYSMGGVFAFFYDACIVLSEVSRGMVHWQAREA